MGSSYITEIVKADCYSVTEGSIRFFNHIALREILVAIYPASKTIVDFVNPPKE